MVRDGELNTGGWRKGDYRTGKIMKKMGGKHGGGSMERDKYS